MSIERALSVVIRKGPWASINPLARLCRYTANYTRLNAQVLIEFWQIVSKKTSYIATAYDDQDTPIYIKIRSLPNGRRHGLSSWEAAYTGESVQIDVMYDADTPTYWTCKDITLEIHGHVNSPYVIEKNLASHQFGLPTEMDTICTTFVTDEPIVPPYRWTFDVPINGNKMQIDSYEYEYDAPYLRRYLIDDCLQHDTINAWMKPALAAANDLFAPDRLSITTIKSPGASSYNDRVLADLGVDLSGATIRIR